MLRSKNPFPLLALSALLGAFGLVATWASLRLRPHVTDVVYTLRPNPATGRVHVRADLSGLAPGRVFLLAPQADLSPAAGPAAMPEFGASDGAAAGSRLWWGDADAHGRLSVSYDVTPRSAGPRHMLLAGARTFVVPLRSDPRAALFARDERGRPVAGRVPGAARRLRVRFVLPAGWDAYTPWAEPAPEVDVPDGRFARLRESLVALGDYLPHEFAAAGTHVEVLVRGLDPEREDALVALVRDCLAAHARAVGPSPHPRLLVVADAPFRGDQAAGETALNAACFDLSSDPDALLRSRSLPRVVSHELFHLWNGGAVDLDAPDLRWFAEGATDYFAVRDLAGAGRLGADSLADELAASFDRLRGNPWADSSLAALGRAYEDEPQAWSATYAKGTLAAWALDLRLEGAGGLARVVRDLVRAGRRPDLGRLLATTEGGAAAGLLDSLSSPRFTQAVAGELAGHGMRLERRASSRITLGFRFFRPGTTEVVDLDPLGPAARHGVRQGDRVVAVAGRPVDDLAVLSEALADAAGGPVAVRLDRHGQRVDVRLTPTPAMTTHVESAPPPRLATRVPPPGGLAP